jgi:D-mannonate dehydratase
MLVEEGLPKFKNKETKNKLTKLLNIKFENSLALKEELSKSIKDYDLILKLIEQSEIHKMKINYNKISKIKDLGYSKEQLKGIRDLDGKTYNYTWELYKDISKTNKSWKLKKKSIKNKLFNKKLKSNLEFIYHTFKEKE